MLSESYFDDDSETYIKDWLAFGRPVSLRSPLFFRCRGRFVSLHRLAPVVAEVFAPVVCWLEPCLADVFWVAVCLARCWMLPSLVSRWPGITAPACQSMLCSDVLDAFPNTALLGSLMAWRTCLAL